MICKSILRKHFQNIHITEIAKICADTTEKNKTFAKHLATFRHHSANFAEAKLEAGGLEAEARAPEEVDGPAELAPLVVIVVSWSAARRWVLSFKLIGS